jgi:hypothetical protein
MNFFFSSKHPEFEYTILEPSFICVLTETGTALGFRFSLSDEGKNFQSYLDEFIQYKEGKKGYFHFLLIIGFITEEQPTPVLAAETPPPDAPKAEKPFLYCLNLVINQKDNTVRRGAVVKAMAVCSRHQYIDVFKPSMILALSRFFANPGAQVLEDFYNALNAMDISGMPKYTDKQKEIIRTSNDKSKHEYSTVINYTTKMNIKIPTTLFPDEVGGVSSLQKIHTSNSYFKAQSDNFGEKVWKSSSYYL